jgi:hypothetical protein
VPLLENLEPVVPLMPSFQLLHFLQAIANRMKGGRPLQAAIAFPDIGVMAAFGQVKISWERRGLAQTRRDNGIEPKFSSQINVAIGYCAIPETASDHLLHATTACCSNIFLSGTAFFLAVAM